MRYSDLFEEYEGGNTPIKLEEAVAYAKKHSPKVLEKYRSKENLIYRGLYTDFGPMIINGNKAFAGKRISANTVQYYSLLVNYLLPAWKSYPARNNSFICTTSGWLAQNYGTPYVVIPHDGTKIGVCPAHDFWFSFKIAKKYLNDMDEFNHFLRKLIKGAGANFSEVDQGPNELLKTFNQVTEVFKTDPERLQNYFSPRFDVGEKKLVEVILEHYDGDIMAFLNSELEPGYNGFYFTNSDNMIPSGEHGNEVWFEGEALFIPSGFQWENFKEML